MRFGPRESPGPDPEHPDGERPVPHPGDIHVAGSRKNGPGQAPADWVPVQAPPPRTPPPPPSVPPPRTEWAGQRPQAPELPPPGPDPAEWTRLPSSGNAPAEPVVEEIAVDETAVEETEPASDKPAPSRRGLSTEPPPSARTREDIPAQPAPWAAGQAGRSYDRPPAAEEPDPMADPQRRRALVDAFVAEFVGSATWQATLAVLEGAFPGLGMAAALRGRTEEVWRSIDALDRSGARKLGVPVWADEAGMAFDLSAHRPPASAPTGPARRRAVRPRASRPYAGAFVVDTLDPLRYHRAVGGPRAPQDGAPAPRSPEGDDTGVVIVADLAAAGPRVLDSAALWRYAGRVVAAMADAPAGEPAADPGRARTRRMLRALRRVVFVDPALGVGLCLQIDAARTPRCLLAFGVDRTEVAAPRFVRL
ncbi:hypothetical protein [Actinomadura macrotermitis]|uniref:Uncharacterized protein n=1 Tax=Actinomadura macrotermitis TaxID=2585200 RepID=A0A7K0BSM2_9ACTN|nr:hypothetical protein [Actinomadura macrotermitis]MQY04198.1 hypothetical protein [Actinomadura macrotermitis]